MEEMKEGICRFGVIITPISNVINIKVNTKDISINSINFNSLTYFSGQMKDANVR